MARKRYQVQCLGDLFQTEVLFQSSNLQAAIDYYQENCRPEKLNCYQQFYLIDTVNSITLGYITINAVAWWDGFSRFEFHDAKKVSWLQPEQPGG